MFVESSLMWRLLSIIVVLHMQHLRRQCVKDWVDFAGLAVS